MNRHSFIFSLFAFLLLLAQQQSVLHPYMHTADWLQKFDDVKKASPSSGACEKCSSLVDLGSAIVPVSMAFHFSFEKLERLSKPTTSFFSVGLAFYQPRAPPLFS